METAIDYLNKVHGVISIKQARAAPASRTIQGRTPRRWASSRLVGGSRGLCSWQPGLVGLVVRARRVRRRRRSGDPRPPPGARGRRAATGATGGLGYPDQPVLVPRTPRPSLDQRLGVGGAGQVRPFTLADDPDRRDVSRDPAGLVRRAVRRSRGRRRGARSGCGADSRSRNRSGSLTLRVPAENFDETPRPPRELGNRGGGVRSRQGGTSPSNYVGPAGARLRIAKARREVLLGLQAGGHDHRTYDNYSGC